MRYIEGTAREQSMLLPPSINEFVVADHPVRVIDAFVNSLDISAYGFTQSHPASTGRKPYHPGDLLKLYIYGYLNQRTSSRMLEKECQRNLEVIWLLRQLAPDFKTIADFRKDNGEAIKQVCRCFVLFCRQAGLISGEVIAIDGSKFKSAASKDSIISQQKLSTCIRRLDQKIEHYLEQLEQMDSAECTQPAFNEDKVKGVLASLTSQRDKAQNNLDKLIESGHSQRCTSEPDAKLMRAGRGGTVAGYNVQHAVDSKHQIVVHHDLTQESNDTRSLKPMVDATNALLKQGDMMVLADVGYSNGEHIAGCDYPNVTVAVPSNRARNNQKGIFPSSVFTYVSEEDIYICPAGKTLSRRTANKKDKLTMYYPKVSDCRSCELRPQCTKSTKRQLSRHFYEEALQKANALASDTLMKRRMAIVEPPFGTLKRLINGGRFRCWGKKSAYSEYSIGVLSYNLLRTINILGVKPLLKQLA